MASTSETRQQGIAGLIGVAIVLGVLMWWGHDSGAPSATTQPADVAAQIPGRFNVNDPTKAFVPMARELKPGNTLTGEGELAGPFFCPTMESAQKAHEMVYGFHDTPNPIAERLQFMQANSCRLLKHGDIYVVASNNGKVLTIKDGPQELYWLFP